MAWFVPNGRVDRICARGETVPTLKCSIVLARESIPHNCCASGTENPVSLSNPWFSGALHLLPRKDQVEEYNTWCMQRLARTTNVYTFVAEHAIIASRFLPPGVTSDNLPANVIPKEHKGCAGLSHTQTLAVGAEVMFHSSIMCEDGLVNGARGMIVGFTWSGSQHLVLSRSQSL